MNHLIFLAAGLSRRFGSDKLLYLIDGRPMYRHLLDRLSGLCRERADCRLLVVTRGGEVLAHCRAAGIETAVNPEPERGISSSVRIAVSALQGAGLRDGDRLVFFNADQPKLTKETIAAFLDGADRNGLPFGAIGDGTELRSPCFFPGWAAGELLRLSGDRGGKSILLRRPEEVWVFTGAAREELEDVDYL